MLLKLNAKLNMISCMDKENNPNKAILIMVGLKSEQISIKCSNDFIRIQKFS